MNSRQLELQFAKYNHHHIWERMGALVLNYNHHLTTLDWKSPPSKARAQVTSRTFKFIWDEILAGLKVNFPSKVWWIKVTVSPAIFFQLEFEELSSHLCKTSIRKKLKENLSTTSKVLKRRNKKNKSLIFFFFAKSTFFPSFLQLIERNESKMQLHDYKTT